MRQVVMGLKPLRRRRGLSGGLVFGCLMIGMLGCSFLTVPETTHSSALVYTGDFEAGDVVDFYVTPGNGTWTIWDVSVVCEG